MIFLLLLSARMMPSSLTILLNFFFLSFSLALSSPSFSKHSEDVVLAADRIKSTLPLASVSFRRARRSIVVIRQQRKVNSRQRTQTSASSTRDSVFFLIDPFWQHHPPNSSVKRRLARTSAVCLLLFILTSSLHSCLGVGATAGITRGGERERENRIFSLSR